MQPDFTEIMQLLKSSNELAKQNNELLRKMHRSAVIAFWFRLLWICIFLGIPFLLYFYLLKPYLGDTNITIDSFMERFEQTTESLLRLEEFSDGLKARQAESYNEVATSTASTSAAE